MAAIPKIVERYRNASGVFLHTVEGRSRNASMLPQVMRRANDGYRIVKSINPARPMTMTLRCDRVPPGWQNSA